MSEDSGRMNYFLIILFAAIAILLLLAGLSYRDGKHALTIQNSSSDDRAYWKGMTRKFMKGYFIGSVGALLTAIAIALKIPVPAEIGCITLAAAFVFSLAILCRKTNFKPSTETENLQKRWKTIFLLVCVGLLFITQLVFQYFNNIKK